MNNAKKALFEPKLPDPAEHTNNRDGVLVRHFREKQVITEIPLPKIVGSPMPILDFKSGNVRHLSHHGAKTEIFAKEEGDPIFFGCGRWTKFKSLIIFLGPHLSALCLAAWIFRLVVPKEEGNFVF